MYGSKATGISPNVLWPTPAEMRDREEYEKVLYDGLTLQEMMRNEQKKQEDAKEAIRKTCVYSAYFFVGFLFFNYNFLCLGRRASRRTTER